MQGHLDDQQFEGYRRRTLAPEELLVADRHLGACSDCRRHLRSAGSLPAIPPLFADMEDALHLSYEQMCSYLDSPLDDASRDAVEQHTLICSSCARELNELQRFDERISIELTPVTAKQAPETAWSLRGWLTGFFAAPQRLRFMAASLGLIIVGTLAMSRVEPGPAAGGGEAFLKSNEIALATHPGLFLGGFAVIALGIVGIVYGLFKRF